jgi:hypothetical protein
MLDNWKDTLVSEVSDAEEVEAEVSALLKEVENDLNQEQLKQVNSMIAEGAELLNIVRVGNGVHNKKYAITIIDGAFGKFEDAIELLEDAGSN